MSNSSGRADDSGSILYISVILIQFCACGGDDNGSGNGDGGNGGDFFLTRKYDDQMKEISSEVTLDDRSCGKIERTVQNYTNDKDDISSGSNVGISESYSNSNYMALSRTIRLVPLAKKIYISWPPPTS